MNNQKNQRRRIWIDPFQTGLLVRIVAYCVVYQVAAWALFAICDEIHNGLGAMGASWPALANPLVRNTLALLILMPPLVVDALRFAHRLVGPLYRFRVTVRAIAAGEPVPLVKLRKGDMLTDFQDDFNAMLRQLEQQGYVVVKAPGAAAGTPAPPAGVVPAAAGSGA